MQNALDVSVLVPIRNEAGIIRESASTIVGQQFAGSLEFLMIDGNSQDGTLAILQDLATQDQRIRILENPCGDLASALNVGLAAARGEFVAKMDAHTCFPPSYIQIGVDRLRKGDTNWVSGPPIPRGIDPWSRRIELALGMRLGVGGSAKWPSTTAAEDEKELSTGVFSGVWRRSVLELLGGWDPAWPVNEDSELASRYLAAGERILSLQSMGAYYVPRSSLSALAQQYSRYGYYRAKTANRHPGSLSASHLAPPALVAIFLAGIVGGRYGRMLARPSFATYAVAQVAASLRAARTASADAALLPAVLTTMHLSFGIGYLLGCARFGVPLASMRSKSRRIVIDTTSGSRRRA